MRQDCTYDGVSESPVLGIQWALSKDLLNDCDLNSRLTVPYQLSHLPFLSLSIPSGKWVTDH